MVVLSPSANSEDNLLVLNIHVIFHRRSKEDMKVACNFFLLILTIWFEFNQKVGSVKVIRCESLIALLFILINSFNGY